MDMKNKWMRVASFLVVFLIMASLSMVRDHRVLGYELRSEKQEADFVKGDAEGTVIVNTSEICKDVAGYAGPVPLEITVTNGVIDSVRALENSETPGFWNRVVEAGLLKSWNGVGVDRALTMSVDGVTGATYSSRAVIENVRAGVGYVVNQHEVSQRGDMEWNVAWVAALLVVLMAAVVPLKVKSQRYRAVQELLNVAVLGFWTGTFVNYTMLLNFMSNGVHSMAALTGVVMLVVAFLYPQLGRSGHYCAWVCPLGSLQDLAGKCSPYKLHIGRRTATVLSWVRRMVWCALLMCMWLGVWVSWIDYELFSVFVVGSAPVWMIVAGVVVVLLSVVVPRPYCRFLCHTGTLLRLSQNIESTNV